MGMKFTKDMKKNQSPCPGTYNIPSKLVESMGKTMGQKT
jgi:hypothetical protein